MGPQINFDPKIEIIPTFNQNTWNTDLSCVVFTITQHSNTSQA